MKCQNCSRNEADFHVRFSYDNNEWGVHLCSECAAAIQKFTQTALSEHQARLAALGEGDKIPRAFSTAALFMRDPESPPSSSPAGLPPDAVEDIRLRRRRNELEALLQEAIGAEEYEQAAKLRDEMKALKKGACKS